MQGPRYPLALLAITIVVLAASAYKPYDMATWWMEVAPVVVAIPILLATSRRFPLTPLVYTLIFVHACILILGAHYTYARVPLGYWVQDLFGFARNHYDRLGHLAQGFIPALIAREILLRRTPLRRGGWLFFLVCCVSLAISAVYEFIEWWAALLLDPAGGDTFLGSQGDIWDAQWDMFLAGVGATVGLATLSRVHQKSMEQVTSPAPP